jgi:hypothetical protein
MGLFPFANKKRNKESETLRWSEVLEGDGQGEGPPLDWKKSWVGPLGSQCPGLGAKAGRGAGERPRAGRGHVSCWLAMSESPMACDLDWATIQPLVDRVKIWNPSHRNRGPLKLDGSPMILCACTLPPHVPDSQTLLASTAQAWLVLLVSGFLPDVDQS